MDWFPAEPTLGWVRWQLDRVAHLRLTSASADLAADYDLLCALERGLLEEHSLTKAGSRSVDRRARDVTNELQGSPRPAHRPLAAGPARQALHTLRAFKAPVRRTPSARGCGWRRTTPRRLPEGSSETPFLVPRW